jgi:hypothetical protein
MDQKVNLQKSSNFFGPRCNDNLKNGLKRYTRVYCEVLLECYLGQPPVVGHLKDGCFQYLTDISWGEVKG